MNYEKIRDYKLNNLKELLYLKGVLFRRVKLLEKNFLTVFDSKELKRLNEERSKTYNSLTKINKKIKRLKIILKSRVSNTCTKKIDTSHLKHVNFYFSKTSNYPYNETQEYKTYCGTSLKNNKKIFSKSKPENYLFHVNGHKGSLILGILKDSYLTNPEKLIDECSKVSLVYSKFTNFKPISGSVIYALKKDVSFKNSRFLFKNHKLCVSFIEFYISLIFEKEKYYFKVGSFNLYVPVYFYIKMEKKYTINKPEIVKKIYTQINISYNSLKLVDLEKILYMIVPNNMDISKFCKLKNYGP